jgi:hypothetical protein
MDAGGNTHLHAHGRWSSASAPGLNFGCYARDVLLAGIDVSPAMVQMVLVSAHTRLA